MSLLETTANTIYHQRIRVLLFSTQQRFLAYTHFYSLEKTLLLVAANLGLYCSLDNVEEIHLKGLLHLTTGLFHQGAEWILAAGEDLATLSFCPIPYSHFEYLFSVYPLEFGMPTRGWLGPNFNNPRWAN